MCGRFVVNVLSLEQRDWSQRFASSIPNKFESVSTIEGLEGLPVLSNCAAVFQCKTVERLEVGDHVLFLGQVQAYHHTEHPTLMFCRGKYVQSRELDALSN